MSENLNIRLLQRQELYRLNKFYKLNESPIDPSKQLLTAAVAELDNRTIVGMLGFELVPHAGPLIVLEPWRGHGISQLLYAAIENELNKNKGTGYYTFPSNDASKHIAEKIGLIKLPWEVWKREF